VPVPLTAYRSPHFVTRRDETTTAGCSSGATVVPVRDHKSLVAWQVANEVARAAFRLCRTEWKPHAAAVFGQLQRAALSVQLNIAEGYALGSRGALRKHLRIAYGSAVETAELLELAMAEDLVGAAEIEPVLRSAERCGRLLLGLIHRYGGER
jgi:four helix bundle protein